MSPEGDSTAEDVEAEIRRLTEELRAGGPDRVRALLAAAYDRRLLGTREENLRRVLVYTDSLELAEEDADLWAVTRVLRGRAYRDRSATGGLGEMDLRIALGFFGEALDHYAGGSPEWGDVHKEIGETLLRSPDYWPAAVEHLHQARATFRQTEARDALAVVYSLLGAFHVRVAAVTGSPDARRTALENYSLALAHTDRAHSPELWARVQIALGRLTRAGGPDTEHIVVSHLLEAVEVLSATDHPGTRVEALEELAAFHLDGGRWADALPYYDEALTVALDSARRPGTVRGRRAAAVGVSELAHRLAYCHYRAGEFDRAVLTLEKGRARLLLEALSRDRDEESVARDRGEEAVARDPDKESASDPPRYRRLRSLAREIRAVESAEYGGTHFIEDADRLESLRREYAELAAELRKTPLDPTIAQLAPDDEGTALVVPLVCPAGSALFVLTAADQHIAPANVLDFPDVTTLDIDRWLEGDASFAGWLPAYRDRADGDDRWRSTVLDVCGELGRLVGGALAVRLRELGVTRLVLVPAAGLQFLPLHAAVIDGGPGSYPFDGDPSTRRPPDADPRPRHLLDEFTIEYAPSAAVRHVLRTRRRGRHLAGRALVAGASRYSSLPPLPAVPDELALVGPLLDAAPLLDHEATRERVLHGMPDAAVLHLACHGAAWALAGNQFRMAWSPPAVLHLGDDGLSFQDILLTDLRAARLVCLSACDTGLVDHTLPWDECDGLATVFLQAGAPAVVGTLWAVDDRSTALLMRRFYENLREEDDPAGALRRAQLWLRDSTRVELAAVYERQVALGLDRFLTAYTDLMLAGAPDDTPYAHAAYWAPFTFTGA